MTGSTAPTPPMTAPARHAPERVLCRVHGARPGPTLLCICGIHGNEPAGVQAAARVLSALGPRASHIRGDFVALAGNRKALAAGRRFIDRDLNRAWTDDRLQRLRTEIGPEALEAEDQEQVELLDAIETVVSAARGPVYVLDLHTTSGGGGPFTLFGDTLPNRAFASHVPVPMILGLEEQLEGTLLAFLGRHGLVAAVFETGQHEEPRAVDRAEAGLWLCAAAAGLLPDTLLPEAARGRKLLQADLGNLPRVLEMRYRHPVAPDDAFRMDPGYRNFQPVKLGQPVARDVSGEVRVPERGRILMPLYQTQGEDGFFLIREVTPVWLTISYALRRMRADRLAMLLPGVHRDLSVRDTVRVNKRVARWFALQLFHLLGYRREEDWGDVLVLRRRPWDDARYVRTGPYPEPLE